MPEQIELVSGVMAANYTALLLYSRQGLDLLSNRKKVSAWWGVEYRKNLASWTFLVIHCFKFNLIMLLAPIQPTKQLLSCS